MTESTTKIIYVDGLKTTTKTQEKEKSSIQRKMAQFSESELDPATQWLALCNLHNDTDTQNPYFSECIRQQIQYKINGYRGQDIKKELYDASLFVNYDYVLSLLYEKELRCFYCKEWTLLFYNSVREQKQWTLDRIDNGNGHNRGNVEIACLICNLRRRTMYHERYAFTKQLQIVKTNDDE